MQSRLVKMPQGQETAIIAADGENPPILDFDPRDVTIRQVDSDLVFTSPDGGRVVVKDYYDTPDAPVPIFLSGDTEIPGDDIIPSHAAPAAGPDTAPQVITDGARFSGDANDETLHGVDSLGGLPVGTLPPVVPQSTTISPGTIPPGASTGSEDGSQSANIPVHINTPPTVAAAIASVTEDASIRATGTLPAPQDVDIRDTPAFIPKNHEAGQYGTLTLDASGNYTYTLNNAAPSVQQLGAGETATETFIYTVDDGHGGTAQNTLTLTIYGTNDAPTVAAATAGVTEDASIRATGTLPAPQDVDIRDTPAFIPQANTQGVYGSLTLDAAGHYTYTLNNAAQAVQQLGAGETATETFTYTVTDGHGGTAQNTLTLTIHGTNDAPTVAAATASATEDTSITATGTLPAPQDVDATDTPAFIPKNHEAGQYGTLTLDASGNYTYTLNNTAPSVQELGADETATDTFTLTVSDGHGGTASTQMIVTVHGTNDAPTVASAIASPLAENTVFSASGVLPSPQDVDSHDVPTFIPQAHTQGVYGSLTLDAAGHYTYTLNNASYAVQSLGEGMTGTEIFTYTVTDGHGGTAQNTLTVTVHGANTPPTVAAAIANVTEDTSITATGTLPAPQDVDIRDTPAFIPQANMQGVYGNFTLAADGLYTYTLNNNAPSVQQLGAGETATETFTYTVTDGHGGTAQNTLTVTVHGTNDAPRLSAAVGTAVEDSHTLVQGALVAHDADIHDTLVFLPKNHEPGLYGTLTLDAHGQYTYALNNTLPAVQGLGAGETLSETFLCVVRDEHGVPAANTLTITIQGTNDAPVATPFMASVTEDSQTTAQGRISVSDPDIHDTPQIVAQPNSQGQYGTLHLQADGTYTYTLNNTLGAVQGLTTGEHLTDTFTYTVTDGHGGVSTSTLTVTINGTNDAPVTAPGATSVREDVLTHISGALPAPTDRDNTADGVHSDTLTFVPMTNGAGVYGVLNLNTNGSYSYTLNNSMPEVQRLGVGQSLQEVFHYAVQDQHGGVSVNTLTVTINGSNDAPTVSAATESMYKATNMLRDTLPTPQDVDAGDTVSFVLQPHTVGRYGALHLNTDGSYFYNLNNRMPDVLNLPQNGTLTDTFTYTVTDNHGAITQSTLTITILGRDIGSTPTLSASTQVTEDSHTVTTGTVALPVSGETCEKDDEDEKDNKDDDDKHGGTSALVTPQAHTQGQYGVLQLQADGTYIYTLHNSLGAVQGLTTGESLTDSFGYTTVAGTGTLVVTIHGTNDAPVVQTQTLHAVENTQTVLSGTLGPINDPDNTADAIHSDLATYVAQNGTAGAYGTLYLSASGSYVYVLNNASAAVQGLGAGESANDVFTYTTVDQHGGSTLNTLTVTVHGTNEAPVAQAAFARVTEYSAPVVTGTLPAPIDPDTHDTHSYTPATVTTAYGQVVIHADGTYTYTLDTARQAVMALSQGETLQDTLVYTVSDTHGGSATNTLNVTIVGTNAAPSVAAATADATVHTEQVAYGIVPTPQDVNAHDTVLFTPMDNVAGQYGVLSLSPTGVYTYTLDNAHARTISAGEAATDTFTYTVYDGHGGTAQNTLTVSIHGVNEAPTVGAASADIIASGLAETSGALPTPQDINLHDTHTFTLSSPLTGAYGQLALDASGNYTYTLDSASAAVRALNAGEAATDIFTFTVDDGHGGTVQNTLTVTIHGVNDTPVAFAAAAELSAVGAGTPESVITGVLPAPQDADMHDTPSYVPQVHNQGAYGVLTLDAAGNYTYALHNDNAQGLQPGQTLTETFTYTVADNHGATTHNTLTLTITGENMPPLEVAPLLNQLVGGPDSLDSLLPPAQSTPAMDTGSHAGTTGGTQASVATGVESGGEDLQSAILQETARNNT